METKISLLENQIERLTNQIDEYKRQVTKLKENEKVYFHVLPSFFVFFNLSISGQCFHFMPTQNTKKPFSGVIRGYKMRTLDKNGLIAFVEGTSIIKI